jgi:pimeloyl-ACP methyl ester carboxylesterase
LPTLRSRGTNVHFLDVGTKKDVVLLLHAFPLHAGMWTRQVDALSKHHRVVAPDYPGLGRSEPRDEPSTMEALAEDVLAIVDSLGVRTAAVVGLSMGGYLAFELYRERPALFRALALCDTRAGADAPEAALARESFARHALEQGLPWVADQVLPKLLKKSPDPAVASAVRGLIAQGTPAGVAAAQRGMAKRPDSTATLAGIACPTRILVGAEDAFTPPPESRKMAAAVRGATLVEIPDAGHLANLEQPAAFEAALLPFLAALR